MKLRMEDTTVEEFETDLAGLRVRERVLLRDLEKFRNDAEDLGIDLKDRQVDGLEADEFDKISDLHVRVSELIDRANDAVYALEA